MALAFQFLGPPQLILENEPVNINRRSIVALLAYLAVNVEGKNSQKHTREYLSTMLWPDYDQAKAYTNLRHTVWEIQRLFGPGRLNTSRDTISLNTHGVSKCSQLSIMNRMVLSRNLVVSASIAERSDPSRISSTAATVCGTRAGSDRESRVITHTPSG